MTSLPLEKTGKDIANMAFEIEKTVQKGRASPTDTTVSTYGGIVLICGGSRRRLAPQNIHMVIGDSLVSHSTAKMVEQVADLKKQSPEIVDPILDAIEGVSLAAIHHLANHKELGRYMNMNHALLELLVSAIHSFPGPVRCPFSRGIRCENHRGWWWGFMVALCAKPVRHRVAQAIQSCDARAIVTGIDTEEARKEKNV